MMTNQVCNELPIGAKLIAKLENTIKNPITHERLIQVMEPNKSYTVICIGNDFENGIVSVFENPLD